MPSPTSRVGRRPSAGSEQQWWRVTCRAPCRRRTILAAPLAPYRRAILARIRPLLVGHAVDDATAHPPPTTTAKAKPTPPLAQHGRRQLRAPGSDLGRQRAGRGHHRHPRRPGPSQPCGRLPTAALHDPTPVGHHGRGNARTADAHWTPTPNTGHLDAQTPTPDTGRWSRGQARVDTRTGHWTPDPSRGP
jgi:hypothetical protein